MVFGSVLASVGAALLLTTAPARALPALGQGRDVQGIHVFPDDKKSNLFYYSPGKLSVALDSDGHPDLRFLQMRYTGTSASGDQGVFHARSVLSFRVQMNAASGAQLSVARARLQGRFAPRVDLRPLPVRKVDLTLNYTPLTDTPGSDTPSAPPPGTGTPPSTAGNGAPPAVGNGAPPDAGAGGAHPAGSGAMENVGEELPGENYWTERVITLSPDDATSQALWTAFHSGKVLLSLSYAFWAEGIMPDEGKAVITGNVPLPDGTIPAPAKDKGPEAHVVLADTVGITVDAKEFPECCKQIDINESVPANYAVMSIYCYDFNNALRPDLQEKWVEIEATSVTGKPLMRTVTFAKSAPDIYSSSMRFQFAVSLKKGYRYRLREIFPSGDEKVSPWREGKGWSQMLDVTSPPEERPKSTNSPDAGDMP